MRTVTLALLLPLAASAVLAGQEQSPRQRPEERSRGTDDALIRAVKRCDVASARALLARGADVNTRRAVKTPLMLAAEQCNRAMIKVLLARGADPNVVTATAHAFFTPLGCAIRAEATLVVIDALIAGGAQVNPTAGFSPLYFALEGKDLRMIRALLARGANVNLRNVGGLTPLMLAAIDSAPEVVEILLRAGADVRAKSDDGQTALSLAMFYRNEFESESRDAVIMLLKAAGAQEEK